jgi:hypothetical protein
MEKLVCATCQSPRNLLKCGLCSDPTCKTCAHVLSADAFSFLPKPAEHLTKDVYCNSCFQSKVANDLEAYEKMMTAAGQVDIYYKDQGKETRLIRREGPPYVINECADRDELILRLAFLAAQDGFTTLVDVDIVGKKVRDGTYQTTTYRGSAVPANARKNQIPKDRSIRHNPN